MIQNFIRSSGATWEHAFLASVPARRGVNEAFHLLTFWSLLHYMKSRKLAASASRSEAVELLLKNGFVSSESLLDTLHTQMEYLILLNNMVYSAKWSHERICDAGRNDADSKSKKPCKLDLD